MQTIHEPPRNDCLIDLEGQSMSTENLEQLLQKTRFLRSRNNLDLNDNEFLRNHAHLDGLISSVFSINHDLKNVVQARQARGASTQDCFKQLRKNIYFLIRNLEVGNYKLRRSEQGFQCMTDQLRNPELDRDELSRRMEDIKDGIHSIERKGKFNCLENMVSALKNLEFLVGDRDAILRKYLELADVIDKTVGECSERMERLRSDLCLAHGRPADSSLREIRELEIKDNYSVLKEVDLNRLVGRNRSSLGPGAVSQYKKLMDSYAHMNNPRSDPERKKLAKKPSQRHLRSQKQLTNLRILSNLEIKSQSDTKRKADFSFQIRESNLLGSKNSDFMCSLAPDPEQPLPDQALLDENRRLKLDLQAQVDKTSRYKKMAKELKARAKDLETMKANLANKADQLEARNRELDEQVANMREVAEDLKNQCYQLEKRLDTGHRKMAVSCQPKIQARTDTQLECVRTAEYVYHDQSQSGSTGVRDSECKQQKSALAEQILSMVSLNLNDSGLRPAKRKVESSEVGTLELLEERENLVANRHHAEQPETEERESQRESAWGGQSVLREKDHANVFLNSNLDHKQEPCGKQRPLAPPSPRQREQWVSGFVKSKIKKLSRRKQLEFKKDERLKKQRLSTLKDLFRSNKNTITFKALKESLRPVDLSQFAVDSQQSKRCSIDLKNASSEGLRGQLGHSSGAGDLVAIHTSNFKHQEDVLESARGKQFETFEDLLAVPARSLGRLESFGVLGKEAVSQSKPQSEALGASGRNDELNQLKKKIEDLEDELEQLVTENEFYKMNWPTQNQMDQLRQQGDAGAAQVQRLTREVGDLQEDLFQMAQSKQQADDRIQQLQEQVDAHEHALAAKDDHIEILKQANSALEYENAEHAGNVVDMEELLVQFESENKERDDQRTQLGLEAVETYGFGSSQRAEQISQMSATLDDLEMQNMQLIRELAGLEEARDQMREQLERTQMREAEAEQAMEDLRMENVLLERSLEKAKLNGELAHREELERETRGSARDQAHKAHKRLRRATQMKLEIVSQQLSRLESLAVRVGSGAKRLAKVEDILRAQSDSLRRARITNSELRQSLQKLQELREQDLAERNKMILVGSEEDMFSSMSRLSNSRLSNSRLSRSRRSRGDKAGQESLREENLRLADQVVGLEDQIKSLKDKYNQLIFERNQWEQDRAQMRDARERRRRRKQDQDYLELVKNSSHISLKKENLELRRKLDRLVALVQKSTNQTESQIWGNFSALQASAAPFPQSSVWGRDRGDTKTGTDPLKAPNRSSRHKPAEEHPLGSLNVTIMSNKHSTESFLNKSGRSDIAKNINGISQMIGEARPDRVEESVLVRPKSGHRRTTSDPKEFVGGSMILRNFAFKKEEKVSHFAPFQPGHSRFGLDPGASRGESRCPNRSARQGRQAVVLPALLRGVQSQPIGLPARHRHRHSRGAPLVQGIPREAQRAAPGRVRARGAGQGLPQVRAAALPPLRPDAAVRAEARRARHGPQRHQHGAVRRRRHCERAAADGGPDHDHRRVGRE